MIDEKKIEGTDIANIPKRIFIIDYQLEQCEVDGISDARLNARPFRTTNGNLVEYLCLDNLWHDASEEPKENYDIFVECLDGAYTEYAAYRHNSAQLWSDFVDRSHTTRWLYTEDLMKGGK